MRAADIARSTVDLGLTGCGSAIMEAHIARGPNPLRNLRQIEDAGAHPIAHTHYAAAVTSAIRAAMAEFADGSAIETVGDGVYQIVVTVAGRRHLVTVQPERMSAAQVAA